MDNESKFAIIAYVEWDAEPGQISSWAYGFWRPRDNNAHLEELRTFINAKHGGSPGIKVTLYSVEDVTGELSR